MGVARLALASALLVLVVGGATAVALWRVPDEPVASASRVTIVGPDGPIFDGVVHADRATALSLLIEASRVGGFAVETRDYPGMGLYVSGIAGHRAHGPDGWVYEAWEDSAWVSGDRSAAHYALESGQALRWSWTGAAT